MPNKRADGQKLIPTPMSEAFVGAIDLAYRKEGYDDRSKFVRAAVKEKLEKLGYKIPVEDAIAPGRTKGKPRK